jgi:hypothetical protein
MHPVVRRMLQRRLEALLDHAAAIAVGVLIAWFAAQGF